MWPIFQLYIALFFIVVAFDADERNAQLKFVDGPIAEIRNTISVFIFYSVVRKQDARGVAGYEDKHVPKCVQVRELLPKNCITEKLVKQPAHNGQHHDQATAQTKPVDTHRLFTGNGMAFDQ